MKLTKSMLVASALALAAGGALAADNKDDPGYNKLDANEDGKVTRAEAAKDKDLAARWKDADRDNDGTLSRAEYLRVKGKEDIAAGADKAKDAVSDDKSASAGAGASASAKAKDDAEPGFNNLDANNDGKITRAEAAKDASLLGKWKDADRDNDGSVSRTEYLIVKGKKDIGTLADKVKDAVTPDEKESSAGATRK